MKNILLLLTLIILGLQLNAQQDVRIDKINQLISKHSSYLKTQNTAQLDLDEFILCEEDFEWDLTTSSFIYTGETTYTYDKSTLPKTLTIESVVNVDDEVEETKMVVFFNEDQEIGSFEQAQIIGGDSLHVYAPDEAGNLVLFVKMEMLYEDEKLMMLNSYIDMTLLFGIPLGFVQTAQATYTYDNNGFLVNEVNYSLDFSSGFMSFSDSTVYTNNGQGLPVESVLYEPDFESGLPEAYQKTNTNYNGDNKPEEVTFSFIVEEQWSLEDMTRYTYNADGRETESLSLESTDNGANWMPVSRDLSEYEDVNLPLGFPSENLSQNYVDGAWVNSTFSQLEDCTSGVEEIQELDFQCWFDAAVLEFNNSSNWNEVKLSIVDVQGRVLFVKEYTNLPSAINTNIEQSGIYFVRLEAREKSGVKKVWK